MIVKLVGYKSSTYKKDGAVVPRIELHTARNPFRNETDVKGVIVKPYTLFGNDCDVLPLPLQVGAEYSLETEQRGNFLKVLSFELVSDGK